MSSIPFNSPEAAKAFMAQQQQEVAAHQRNVVHKVNELLESLDSDKLQTLDHILLNVNSSKHVMGYLRGQIDLLREQKFNICRCGINHDEELAGEFKTPDDEAAVLYEEPVVPDDLQLMEQYGIGFVPDNVSDDYPTKLRCARCLTPIVSIEDRMLREPGIGGCSGCQQMSKDGTKWYGR